MSSIVNASKRGRDEEAIEAADCSTEFAGAEISAFAPAAVAEPLAAFIDADGLGLGGLGATPTAGALAAGDAVVEPIAGALAAEAEAEGVGGDVFVLELEVVGVASAEISPAARPGGVVACLSVAEF